jgi:DNA adenine methylase
VLLAKDPHDITEVVNDIDGDIATFWRVMRYPHYFEQFQRFAQATPFHEGIWEEAATPIEGESLPLRAWRFFVRVRQSLAGRRESFAPISLARRRRGMCEQVSAWLSAVDGLPAVAERLSRMYTIVRNRDALEIMTEFDHADTLQYLDPPYLPSTRAAKSVYRHECDEDWHRRFLEVAANLESKVMISGYPSELYGERLKSWECHVREVPNAAAGGKRKRIMRECVWTNFRVTGEINDG